MMIIEKFAGKGFFYRFFYHFLLWNHLREQIIRQMEEKLRHNHLNRDRDRFPLKVQEDKFIMARNMIRAVDRGLREGLISRHVWTKFIFSFLRIYFNNGEKISSFRKKYGQNPPSFLTLSPTRLCNLRCSGCYANSSHSERQSLDFEVASRIIREQKELWGSHFTVISGGEPFAYRNQGRTFFDLLAEHPDSFFLIYTNGTLIDRKTAQRLADLGNATPAISVEGFEKETDARRGKGVFKKILRAFENLRSEGVPFGISVTATRENAELILNEELIDYYFHQQGALYGWIFQYMPIGRGYTLELAVTAEQRRWMYEKTWEYIREEGLFLADFWNCGTVSNGCISAGKPGGYIYIDWNGNVLPCVFNPFTVENIIDTYRSGGNLNDVLFSEFFLEIRKWQHEYALNGPPQRMGNVLVPCAIRDHYRMMYDLIKKTEARPADEDAAQAIVDSQYREGLIEFDRKINKLMDEIWKRDYIKI